MSSWLLKRASLASESFVLVERYLCGAMGCKYGLQWPKGGGGGLERTPCTLRTFVDDVVYAHVSGCRATMRVRA